MKSFVKLTAVTCVALGTAMAAEAKDIKKENQFLDAVAGKTLSGNEAILVISADGKLTGKLKDGRKVAGAWVWSKRFWCRNLVVGGKALPQDCQTVSLDGDQVTFIRNKGKGDSGGTYTITN
ncbi:hypothetical protein SAMN05444358_103155 [Ruegeria halocynthiae]|uniref:Dihydrodipicolinate reductase n=1 Tax=Ruegeria halocynthiae TaxID=985054 RepID=A0A1H2ZB68_9RHOB|nr:hypothetical protein [Ruegeria halocynthiae]SDX14567.1 hypothetical protein SAMN05444358_103155 [Ruegeria halocynthiae]